MEKTLLAPPLQWFDDWMQETGQQIPDFDALPSVPELPDLLRCENGEKVGNPEDWQLRRKELKTLVQHWLIGSWPKSVPFAKAEILEESRENGAIWRRVELTFREPMPFSFDIQIMLPEGDGPFPVFLTQANHRRWAALGVSRGYLCCVYPGADVDDQSGQLQDVFPEQDWSKLTRRAWLGCRALDYVLSLKQADPEAIAITGHSRNGKQSLIAAAMDERITAVISSSSGSGGVVPWRCSSEFCFQESVEFMTRQTGSADWFHPRIRLFTGREDKLPVDNHALLGLIAPRACLIADAMTDGCGSMFGVEMSVNAARPVYDLLDARERLSIMWRWGNHETDAQVIGRYFDWYDTVFHRATYSFPASTFFSLPQTLASPPEPPAADASPANRLQWLLGDAPASVSDPGGRYGALPQHRAAMVGVNQVPEGVQSVGFSFSEYVSGQLYFPAQYDEPLTPIIWLHPFSHSYGAAGAYMVGGQIFYRLAQEGYAVLAFTQLGCGQRAEEGRDFYSRYPGWSKMGKMVRDVRGAVDFLMREQASESVLRPAQLPLPEINTSAITVLGYSLGGLTALLAAAQDQRISAVASFCGAVPFRQQQVLHERGAMQRFWQLTDLLPRLQVCADEKITVPVGLDDLIQMISPRPCLLVAPHYDREVQAHHVRAAVEKTQPYPELTFLSPHDYNRFQSDQHNLFLEWMRNL